jgi:hypothetical protein
VKPGSAQPELRQLVHQISRRREGLQRLRSDAALASSTEGADCSTAVLNSAHTAADNAPLSVRISGQIGEHTQRNRFNSLQHNSDLTFDSEIDVPFRRSISVGGSFDRHLELPHLATTARGPRLGDIRN